MLRSKLKKGLASCETEITQQACDMVSFISQSKFEQALKACKELQCMLITQLIVSELLTEEIKD